jgi:hypothetical protein
VTEEYLTISEVALRLKVKPKTIKNKMAAGGFTRGVHYFRPSGMSARFKWSAVVEWLEREQATPSNEDSIPMARGYQLGAWRSNHRLIVKPKPILSVFHAVLGSRYKVWVGWLCAMTAKKFYRPSIFLLTRNIQAV